MLRAFTGTFPCYIAKLPPNIQLNWIEILHKAKQKLQ